MTAYGIGGLVTGAALVRKLYSLDANCRVTPHTPDDEIEPHLSSIIFNALVDTCFFISHAASAYAVTSHSCSWTSLSTPFAAHLSHLRSLELWHMIPVLFGCGVFIISLSSPSHETETHTTWHGHVRELLAVPSLQMGSTCGWQWLAGCAGCVVLVALVSTPLAGRTKKRNRDDQVQDVGRMNQVHHSAPAD